ncbi:MAG TPA: bifunctional [glutamate--ammonia ligase]-adenylyl-L-tyrosine phosphorylase/[glutamate--ammonia-ligase] adenylyltransferase [bacterium]|mgnify:FL=1|nr:bifunctional [glutamate--ammonia ligase]-adenylyl-L-tyrosine phosphorylase/[glutamate--ammonia-ligase] adenylyltransferase [bacterium]
MPENPYGASPQWLDLLTALESHGIALAACSNVLRDRLARLSYFSPRLTEIASARPDLILPWMKEGALDERFSKTQLRERLEAILPEVEDPETAIRFFHRSHILRIAWRDLCHLADIQVITEELSDLADVILEAVYHRIWTRLTSTYGEPRSHEEKTPAHLAIIALGKLGGRELNFSSDIDLMFVYDHGGKTTGGTNAAIDNKKFFTLLAQGICDFLSKPTPLGFLYRVDTRLRPEGERGELAVSLAAVEIYYHSYGQNWERQALLKARPVAGNPDTGRQFIQLITPFTYRKYVDEIEIAEVLRSIDSLRRRSLAAIGSPAQQANNFKNGYGGIREIEFFVQAVQMLYGGQYPEIKLAGTLLSLQRMHESHLLHARDFAFLTTAYKFLRRIEHRLQMTAGQQVYDLPTAPIAQKRLVDSLDLASWDEFKQKYEETTRGVRQIYEGVFQREDWNDTLEPLIESQECTEEIKKLLASYEFEDPPRAFAFLKALQTSPDIHLQPKTTRLFKAILPRLLVCLKNSPDSDLALSNFEQLVTSFKARSALYEALYTQPPFLELLVSVTSGSSFLTRLVLRDPSLMETIGHDGFLEEVITPDLLQHHLELIEQAYPAASRRDHLLRVQNAAMFRSGIRFILGLSDVESMGKELTHIADFILEKSLSCVLAQMAEKYPDFTSCGAADLAILGYGKLGGREFNVASDCDLVFFYSESRNVGGITSAEYFHRFAAQMTRFLEEKSALGFLYNTDTRLRPHGQNSPLAGSFATFQDYYRHQAQFWEKMALTRARFIGGNPQARDLLEELKKEVLFQKPPNRDEIQSILDMRRKIESAKGDETLKAGPGGLVDVEFIAQTLVLRYGFQHASVRSTSTFAILRAAAREALLPLDEAKQLIVSYTFLREVENRLRIVNNISMDAIPADPAELEKLTRRYALRLDTDPLTPESFLEKIGTHTTRVRTIFDRFFERMLEESGR